MAEIGDQTVVVFPGHDEVSGRSPGAGRERCRATAVDQAEVDQVVANDPAQLAAVLPGVGHEQHVLTGEPGDDVGAPGGLEHQPTGAASDPAVLVIGLQRAVVALAQPQAGPLLPLGGEPDRAGQLSVAEVACQQGHPAAALHRGELLVITGD